MLDKLREFKKRLAELKRELKKLDVDAVSRKALRQEAESIATMWVEELRSPLEHKFALPKDVIKDTSEQMKKLHVLSRPNNLKASYIKVIAAALKRFDDRFILPIQQSALQIDTVLDLPKLVASLKDADASEYLQEAIDCAAGRHRRASVVLGWCAAVDRIQKKIMAVGLSDFNEASSGLKGQKGRFKRWTKEFTITTLSGLQEVFDKDLIVVLEGMGLIDSNQADRLSTCFQYRNHSAHPGEAPIEDAHLVAFFTDVSAILLANPDFDP